MPSKLGKGNISFFHLKLIWEWRLTNLGWFISQHETQMEVGTLLFVDAHYQFGAGCRSFFPLLVGGTSRTTPLQSCFLVKVAGIVLVRASFLKEDSEPCWITPLKTNIFAESWFLEDGIVNFRVVYSILATVACESCESYFGSKGPYFSGIPPWLKREVSIESRIDGIKDSYSFSQEWPRLWPYYCKLFHHWIMIVGGRVEHSPWNQFLHIYFTSTLW